MYFKFQKDIAENYEPTEEEWEKEIDENYEPTEKEIIDYGVQLGLTLPDDKDLLYITQKCLKDPLPSAWRAFKTREGDIYYKNIETSKSQWENPCENDYKQLIREAKSLKRLEKQKLESKSEDGLNSQIDTLRNKAVEILNRPDNPELEMDFRTTCSAFRANNNFFDPSLIQAYKDYLNAYERKTSLYTFIGDRKNHRSILYIYTTEFETAKSKTTKNIPQLLDYTTCIAQLPNGKLFCYGNEYPSSGITVLIDLNGGVEMLPSGTPCNRSSCIYFNNSVYCFGGKKDFCDLVLSSRFDLDQNRWIKLTSLPKADLFCNNIILDGNILTSGYENRNLWLYSIDIDSFSTIPYEFTHKKVKILIKAERLYLIECCGSIYECESGSYTNWRKIAQSTISCSDLSRIYCSYNKGGWYIGALYKDYSYGLFEHMMTYECYKFDLNTKSAGRLLSLAYKIS